MKNYKRLLISMLTIIMAVSLFVSTGILTVFADEITNSISEASTQTYSIASEVDYGDTLDFGLTGTDTGTDTVTIVAPNGETKENLGSVDANKYTFDQIGVYGLSFSGGYTTTIYCTLDATYEMRIDHQGADIPTYTETGLAFTVPNATLWYIDDTMDEYEELDSANYTLSVTTTESTTVVSSGKVDLADYASEGKTYSYAQIGTYIVEYNIQLGTGSQNYSQAFTVRVQSDMDYEEKPGLTVTGYSTSASLNTEVTLPIATTTDEYDSNVKVEVEVTFDGADVPAVIVNDSTGYATELDGEEVVEFDNYYVTSFYPMEIGNYYVKYTATNDLYDTSSIFEYVINVEDRAAPQLMNIDDYQIPSTWGLSTNYRAAYDDEDDNDNDGLTLVDNKITFPYPEYIDNSTGDASGVTRVSFTITDTVNDFTVIKFYNIYDQTGDDNTYKYDDNDTDDGVYFVTGSKDDPETYTFTEDGFEFDFTNYQPTFNEDYNEKYDTSDRYGSYTAVYQARDEENNITTKTYNIYVQDSYTDSADPNIVVEFDDYVYLVDETTYTVPTATITDADTRLETVYTITDADDEDNFLQVENGEVLDFDEDTQILQNDVESIYYEEDEDGNVVNTLDLSDVEYLIFSITSTDIVGNTYTEEETIVYVTNDIITDEVNLSLDTNGTALTVDEDTDECTLGSFEITGFEYDYRRFAGFEMKLVKIVDGTEVTIDGISLTTYYDCMDTTNCKIVVEDITVSLAAGDYKYTIRAFDITGASTSSTFDITIGDSGSAGGQLLESASTSIPTTGSTNTSYTLKNESFYAGTDLDESKAYIVRKISNAGNFSLMGIEFTSYSQGSYYFTDGYFNTSGDFVQMGEVSGNSDGAYSFIVNDTTSTVFEVQGMISSYTEKNATVTLPSVIAHNTMEAATVTLVVKDPDGPPLATTTTVPSIDESGSANTTGLYGNGSGSYSFNATKDGIYTLTYTASVNGSVAATKTVTIYCGDLVTPSFYIDDSDKVSSYYDEEDTFNFAIMYVYDDSDDLDSTDGYDEIKFTKTLYSPSGEAVYTISGWGEDYAEATTASLSDDDDDGYVLSVTGEYTLVYAAEDAYGNESIYTETFSVVGDSGNSNILPRVIQTVLIIVGVLLIAGIILYFIRFHKIKVD